MTGRNHLSIGEVLSLLKEEFPDVTISKIRFLESQGLVDPERTPSGYRKFYEEDIDRLRWVLRQQRDAFLPLKVIKGRLGGSIEASAAPGGEAAPAISPGAPSASRHGPGGRGLGSAGRPGAAGEAGEVGGNEVGPAQLFEGVPVAAAKRQGRGGSGRRGRQSGPAVAGRSGHVVGAEAPEDELSLEELLRETGAEPSTVEDLERYGLISPRSVAGAPFYDAKAVVIARLAAAFARHGVEARHLRAYKGAAEREAGMVQQVVMPLVKQRNPEARRAAAEVALELSRLGGELREALLRSALGDLR
jgi:DNA-binding transcriptional MerR regulator